MKQSIDLSKAPNYRRQAYEAAKLHSEMLEDAAKVGCTIHQGDGVILSPEQFAEFNKLQAARKQQREAKHETT